MKCNWARIHIFWAQKTASYPLGYRGIVNCFIHKSNCATIYYASTQFSKIHEDWILNIHMSQVNVDEQ